MNRRKYYTRCIYFTFLLAIFLFGGFYLGVLPFVSFYGGGLELYVSGGAAELLRSGNWINYAESVAYPSGMPVSEGFLLYIFVELFMFLGIPDYVAMQFVAFIIYLISFICLKKLLEKINLYHKFIILVGLFLFYFDPFLRAQRGLPQEFYGILALPVVALADYQCYAIIKKHRNRSSKYYLNVVVISFLMKLFATALGWYIAVISACMTCLFLILTAIQEYRNGEGYIVFKQYVISCLIPWLLAMGVVYSITPSFVSDFKSPLEFYNGNSVNIATLLFPGDNQCISQIISSLSELLHGARLAGDGSMWSNYLGYAILLGFYGMCVLPKLRNKEWFAAFEVFLFGFILSLGPGLKWIGTTQSIGYKSYFVPMENVIQFPWSEIFISVFPLTSMRAVYRWIIIPKFVLLVGFSVFLYKIAKKNKLWMYALALISCIEFLPTPSAFMGGQRALDNVLWRQREAMQELQKAKSILEIEDGRTVLFATYDLNTNAFLAPSLNAILKTNSYTGGGDKAITRAYKYTPGVIKELQCSSNPEEIARLLSSIREYHICDYVVFPYFGMREQSYHWPAPKHVEKRCKDIVEQVKRYYPNCKYYSSPHYTIVDLRDELMNGEVKANRVLLHGEHPFEHKIFMKFQDEIYFYCFVEGKNLGKEAKPIIKVDIKNEKGEYIAKFAKALTSKEKICKFDERILVPRTEEKYSVLIYADNHDGEVELRNLTISAVDGNAFIFPSNQSLSFINGWYSSASWGAWGRGKKQEALLIPHGEKTSATVFLRSYGQRATVDVYVDHVYADTIQVPDKEFVPFTLMLPKGSNKDKIYLAFINKNQKLLSPKERGESTDARKLSIAVKSEVLFE